MGLIQRTKDGYRRLNDRQRRLYLTAAAVTLVVFPFFLLALFRSLSQGRLVWLIAYLLLALGIYGCFLLDSRKRSAVQTLDDLDKLR